MHSLRYPLRTPPPPVSLLPMSHKQYVSGPILPAGFHLASPPDPDRTRRTRRTAGPVRRDRRQPGAGSAQEPAEPPLRQARLPDDAVPHASRSCPQEYEHRLEKASRLIRHRDRRYRRLHGDPDRRPPWHDPSAAGQRLTRQPGLGGGRGGALSLSTCLRGTAARHSSRRVPGARNYVGGPTLDDHHARVPGRNLVLPGCSSRGSPALSSRSISDGRFACRVRSSRTRAVNAVMSSSRRAIT
jgi:hypothetical protein